MTMEMGHDGIRTMRWTKYSTKEVMYRMSYLVFSPEICGKILNLFYGKDFPHPVDGIYPCKRTLNIRTFNVVKCSRVQRD